ncbi:hypothetical protein DVH24_000495 [Malus domestica]|uniref:Uncharacterized protein n=1 Tax=Malus domestica TaxID=3750 RepID=A0A498J0V7_MALDO|nr:hypothetical protein DVH24_000495 [Malus domestica]
MFRDRKVQGWFGIGSHTKTLVPIPKPKISGIPISIPIPNQIFRKPNFRESRNSFGISGQIENPEMILGFWAFGLLGFWAFGLKYYVFGLKLNLLTLLGCNLLRNPLQYVPIARLC